MTVRRLLLQVLVVAIAGLMLVMSLPPAAQATHGDDGTYDQRRYFEWTTDHIDVLVVPPTHGRILDHSGILGGGDTDEAWPYTSDYLQATLDALDDWERVMEVFGPSWLSTGVELHIHVLGQGFPDNHLIRDPEVIVVNEEANYYSGVALAGDPCVASATKFGGTIDISPNSPKVSRTYTEYYNVVGHEIGHCLALDHPGDFGRPDTYHPQADIMSYGPPDIHHCPSNLNAEALKLAFGDAVGHPQGESVAHVSVNNYAQMNC